MRESDDGIRLATRSGGINAGLRVVSYGQRVNFYFIILLFSSVGDLGTFLSTSPMKGGEVSPLTQRPNGQRNPRPGTRSLPYLSSLSRYLTFYKYPISPLTPYPLPHPLARYHRDRLSVACEDSCDLQPWEGIGLV